MKRFIYLFALFFVVTVEAISQNISKSIEIIQDTKGYSSLKITTQSPLLSDNWGGVNCIDDTGANVYPLNHFTPNNYSAGCVAISMAQVLHYWEWPNSGVGSHTYTDSYGSSQKTYSVDFSSHTYDYSLMIDNYYGVASTNEQQRAVGYLAYHAAVAVDMDFESTGSTSNVDEQPAALDNYFRFSGHYKTRTWSSFWTRMKENLADGLPVLISIKDVDGSGAGHALVVDAYDDVTGKYHLNWGWHGTNNGWYDIEFAWDGTGGGYDRVEGAVFDILPDPEITDIVRTSVERDFTLKWLVSDKLNWDSFSVEQQFNGGSWSVIASDVMDTQLDVSVADAGTYNYRVRAKVNGAYYYNSYSEEQTVIVKDDIVALDFDGDDSFYVSDNTSNDLDISSEYTIETWFNVASHTDGTYPVLLDRKTVFSLYVITDGNSSADYALRFVARNSSGSIIASLRTDYSSSVLNFGDWHHVAITSNNNKAQIYIDGNLIESSTDSDFNLSASSNALNIGARYWSTYERYMDGKLDGISISNTAKYTSNFVPDILVNYPVDANTVLSMNLDEGTGTSIGDAANNFSGITLRSSPNQPNWHFETYVAQEYTWDGFEDSNWYNPNNWITTSTMSLPRSGDDIVIDLSDVHRAGNDIESILPEGEYTFNNIVIRPGNNFNLPENSSFNINGFLLNEGVLNLPSSSNITVENEFINIGTLSINSDATYTGSLIVNGGINNTGTISIERYLDDAGKWQLVSSPTNNENTAVFKGHFLNEYVENEGVFNALYATSYIMIPGEGYVSKLDWGTTDGVPDNPNPIVFNADVPNTTSVELSLEITDDDINEGGAHVSNTYFDLPLGFHLLGNPFTSNLDWNAVYNYGSNSSSITDYLYFYVDGGSVSDPDHTPPVKEGWQVYKAGTASSDSLIALGQGFGVVMVDNTSTKSITIPISARTHETVANVFHKKNENKENYLEVNVISNNIIDKAILQFNENATANYDREFDAYKIKSFSNSPVVSFIGDDLQKLAVSEMPTTESVDLGFSMGEPGEVTLSLSNVHDFNRVFLEDKLENNFVDILFKPYSFYFTDDYTDKDRFTLHFEKQALGSKEEQFESKIYSNGSIVYIKSNKELSNATLEIYNLSGQKVFSKKYPSLHSNELLTDLNKGVYIVKIFGEGKSITSKIILR